MPKCQVLLGHKQIRVMTKQKNNNLAYEENTDRSNINNLPILKKKEQLNTIITNKDGTPDFLAINIYWDSLRSWYAPMKQHQSDGNVVQIKKLKTYRAWVLM